jgi:hypothetical protein
LFAVQGSLVWWLAVRLGYVSDRHILMMVLCSIFQAVAVTIQSPFRVGSWLRAWRNRQQTLTNVTSAEPPVPVSSRMAFLAPSFSLLFLLLMTGAGLSKTLQPLHGNRLGHHEAGMWMAEHIRPGDIIEDDHRWATYYSGHVFKQLFSTDKVTYKPITYGLVSRVNEKRNTPAPHLHTDEEMRARGGWVVYQWPPGIPQKEAKVVLYQLPSR